MADQLIKQWKEDNKTRPIKERLEWLEDYVSILLEQLDEQKRRNEAQREINHEAQTARFALGSRIDKLEGGQDE